MPNAKRAARSFWAREDDARRRREAIERNDGSVMMTAEEHVAWLERNGYIVGVWSRGEGMAEE